MNPPGLFIRTSIPFIWRSLSAFLPARTPWLRGPVSPRCSDRYLKTFSTASTLQAGSCGKEIFTDAKACYAGAASLGFSPSKSNNTVNDPTKPSGCAGTAVAGGFEIEFNSAATKVSCGTGNNATHPRAVGQVVDDAIVTFDTSVDLAKDLVTITARCCP